MALRRTYDQYCGLATALDIVGERWTPLLIRDLTMGPKRFTDLLDGLPGLGRSLLIARIRQLTADGIVRRRELPPPASSIVVYELTERGRRLGEALEPLARWGFDQLGDPDEDERLLRADWYLIHFRRMLRPEASVGLRATYEFRFPDATWHLVAADGTIELLPGAADAPHLVAEMDLETFSGLGMGRLTGPEAIASGRMKVTGDPAAYETLRKMIDPTAMAMPGSPPPQPAAI